MTQPNRLQCRAKCVGLILACLLAGLPGAHARGHASSAPAVTLAAPEEPAAWTGESGVASYYNSGERTAAGTRFNPAGLTAAHPWLPFGTPVRVTLAETGRSVVVVVTDRLYSSRRVVDLSLGAARYLGMIRQGIAQVSLSPV
jgi:rare lipoprotein A